MLDNDLLELNMFPNNEMTVLNTVVMKDGLGNEIPVLTIRLDVLKLGAFELKNIPILQTAVKKPVDGVNIHILGNDVLKRFNTVFDLQNNVVYMKPNSLYDLDYHFGN